MNIPETNIRVLVSPTKKSISQRVIQLNIQTIQLKSGIGFLFNAHSIQGHKYILQSKETTANPTIVFQVFEAHGLRCAATSSSKVQFETRVRLQTSRTSRKSQHCANDSNARDHTDGESDSVFNLINYPQKLTPEFHSQ